MHPALWKAAKKGDVQFLKEAVGVEQPEYFLERGESGNNMFHLAAWEGKVKFLKEAMNILPIDILKQLMSQKTENMRNHNLLHMAPLIGDITIFKCIIEMYASLSWNDELDLVKPWCALTRSMKTPLMIVLSLYQADEIEKCAMAILSLDPQLECCTIADRNGNTPLYYALEKGFNLVAEKILMSTLHPSSLVPSPKKFSSLFSIPVINNYSGNMARLLLQKDGCLNDEGNTSLHSDLIYSRGEALEILSTCPAMGMICNNKGESAFFLAVSNGIEPVIDAIIRIVEPRFHLLRRNDGTTVLHRLSKCSEKTGRMLLEKYWWLINLQDDQGKTALDFAKENNTLWLVNLLRNPSVIHKQDFDWIEACKKQESDAVLAFVDNCHDLLGVCREKNDSPLHHISLPTYRDYLNFLKKPSIAELKNTTDLDCATPLHRALERKDMQFAKALLLDDGVERIIRDHAGTTAMDLLAKLCEDNDDWEKMCKQIKVNPYLRTSYIQPGTNLEQMRNTLSVIAALLATITFAAGFTLPGGIDSNNGQALLAKKAAFLVFLLADVYAMCTSMVVLFCLVWSMVSEPDMARLLVDRSVFVLMQSLYATLLAFMTGIYTVIAHSSSWAAIVIFVMCSIIGITTNRTILDKVIALLVPAANTKKKKDPMQLLEEGYAGESTTGKTE